MRFAVCFQAQIQYLILLRLINFHSPSTPFPSPRQCRPPASSTFTMQSRLFLVLLLLYYLVFILALSTSPQAAQNLTSLSNHLPLK